MLLYRAKIKIISVRSYTMNEAWEKVTKELVRLGKEIQETGERPKAFTKTIIDTSAEA